MRWVWLEPTQLSSSNLNNFSLLSGILRVQEKIGVWLFHAVWKWELQCHGNEIYNNVLKLFMEQNIIQTSSACLIKQKVYILQTKPDQQARQQ